MAEEMELYEGADEIAEQEADDVNVEEFEMTDEELEDISGGRKLTASGPQKKVYCPWCGAYHNCTPCGRITTVLGGKTKVNNMPIWYCKVRKNSFYGPSTTNKYWDTNGIPIR